ncbi:hypothetical protein V8E36_009454 [Tilletia maclaganii]
MSGIPPGQYGFSGFQNPDGDDIMEDAEPEPSDEDDEQQVIDVDADEDEDEGDADPAGAGDAEADADGDDDDDEEEDDDGEEGDGDGDGEEDDGDEDSEEDEYTAAPNPAFASSQPRGAASSNALIISSDDDSDAISAFAPSASLTNAFAASAGPGSAFLLPPAPPPHAPGFLDAPPTDALNAPVSSFRTALGTDLLPGDLAPELSGLAAIAAASSSAQQQQEQQRPTDELQAQLDQLRSETGAQIAALQAENLALSTAEKNTQNELVQTRAQAEQDLSAVRAELKATTDALTAERAESEVLRSKLGDITNQLTEATTRIAELERDKADVAAAAAAAELGQLPDGSDAAVGAPQAVIASLRIQLKSTASSNRELLRALEREKSNARVAEDRAYELNIKAREAQNEISRHLSEIQSLKNTDSARNFKLASVSAELELSRKELDFVKNELVKLRQSSAQFRTTKTAELARLTASAADAEARATALDQKVSSLQAAYDKGYAKQNELLERVVEAERRCANDAAAFQTEMETQLHLVKLHEQRASDADRRAKAVESQWDGITRGWKEREDKAQLLVAEEREKREAAEREKEQLQTALDQLAEGVGIQVGTGAVNGAAEQALLRAASAEPGAQAAASGGAGGGGIFGALFGASRARSSTPAGPVLNAVSASPSAQLASRLQKSGKSFTQVYHELAVTTEELRREREEHRRVAEVLREVFEEANANEARRTAEREDASNTAKQLEVLNREFALVCSVAQKREKELKRETAELARVSRENALLESQVVDQGRQIRALLREAVLRDDPSAAERLEDDGTDLAGLSRTDAGAVPQDTNAIITANLVTFSSLSEMVTQNQRLLRMTRELSTRMEARERELASGSAGGAANGSYGMDEDELEELKSTLDRLEEQLRAERSNKKALTAERDLLKSRLQRATEVNSNGASSNGNGAAGGGGGVGASATAAADAALLQAHELLRIEHERLQKHYETYRNETAEDMRQLKEDISDARRESHKLSATAAKERAGRQAADERFQILQQTFDGQRDEVKELSRQAEKLRTSLAKAEGALQSMDAALSDTRARLEIERNARATASAERDLAKNMEKRVVEEHRSLLNERSNLANLLQQVQNMQLELERVGSQNRERLEAQVVMLESNVKDLKERLAKEEAEHRNALLRREVEAKEAQVKLDSANAEMLEAKKSLVDTNGKLAQLQTKHDELSKELQLKVEKLAVYERQASEEGEDGVSKEKKLEMELAEVRGQLKSLAVELEAAKAHVEQYKSIAQGAEDATEQLTATLEETKRDAAAQVAAKENEMESLKQRMSTFVDELNKAQEESSGWQKELAAQKAEFNSQKKELEDALTQLTGAEEEALAREGPIRSDRDQQARLAAEAERKYQSELVSHARDVEELYRVREQLRKAQVDSREAVQAKETAEAKLTGSEASWVTQRDAIQREVDDLKKSIDDLKKQNSLLHDALETANVQANKLRQAHAEAGGDNFDPDQSVSTIPSAELSEVVRFLRKEKEIVDVQLELSRQEAARLRQSLDYANSTIDKLRTELAEERGKVVAASGNSAQQQDLLEKVQQVNLLRESNATLRAETERTKARIASMETQLREAQAELQPLRERATLAEAQLESSREQATILEADSKRWQGRVQSILAQYNQQDPEELRVLKEQAAKVDELLALNNAAQEEAAAAQVRHNDLRERFRLLRVQTTERLNLKDTDHAKIVKTLEAEKQETVDKVTALQAKLDAAGVAATASGTESAKKAVAEAQVKWNAEKEALEKQKEQEAQKVKDLTASKTSAEAAQKQAESKLAELQKELNGLRAGNSAEIEKAVAEKLAEFKKSAELGGQLDPADSNLLALQERLAKQEEELKQAHARIAELEAALAAAAITKPAGEGEEGSSAASNAAEIEALKAQHIQELAKVRTEATAAGIEKQRELEATIAKLKEGQSATEEGAGGGVSAEPDPEKVEEEVQKRLSALENEREAAQVAAVKTAVDTQLKEVTEKHKAEVQDATERAKTEANLRNQLHLSKRDKTIEKLEKELAELKNKASAEAEKPAAAETAAPAAAVAEPADVKPAEAAKPAATPNALRGHSIATRTGPTLRGSSIAGASTRAGPAAAAAAAAAASAASTNTPAATPTGPAKRKLGAAAGNDDAAPPATNKRAKGGGGRGGRGRGGGG